LSRRHKNTREISTRRRAIQSKEQKAKTKTTKGWTTKGWTTKVPPPPTNHPSHRPRKISPGKKIINLVFVVRAPVLRIGTPKPLT